MNRFILLLCLKLVCMEVISQESLVSASIDGLGNDTVVIELNPLSSNRSEEIVVTSDNKFIFHKLIDKPTLIFLKPRKAFAYNTPAQSVYLPQSKRISLVMLPGDTSVITGSLGRYDISYTIGGAAINRELELFHTKGLDKKRYIYRLEQRIDSLFRLGKQQEISLLMQELTQLKAASRENSIKYIQDNPDSDISLLLLVSSNSPDTFGEHYASLSERVKNGVFSEILKERSALFSAYLNASTVVAGAKARDFNLIDIKGNSFSLADQKGKYVVLDFWGSWCVPCIQGLPKMKEYYEKYKTTVEFVGIACNDLPGPWQAAVKKYDMKWTQTLDNRDIENKIASVYGIQLYPTKILINPEGVIEGVFSGEGIEFYKKLDSLIPLSLP